MTKGLTLSHTFLPFCLAPKLLSGDWSQILRDASHKLSYAQQITIDSQRNAVYPGNSEKF